MSSWTFTSESVTEGHPDKMADQISDAVLDALLEQDPTSRVACESFLTTGLVVVAGEITTKAYVEIPDLVRRGVKPDLLTDQTSAHDPLNGYVPAGISLEKALELRVRDPAKYQKLSSESMARHVEAMLELRRRGSHVFDYGNNLRAFAQEGGVRDAFAYPGFVPAYIRPLFCRGVGPFRWAALSGDPEDIYRTDAKVKELIPNDRHLHQWLDMARSRIKFRGSAGSGTASGRKRGCSSTSWSRAER